MREIGGQQIEGTRLWRRNGGGRQEARITQPCFLSLASISVFLSCIKRWREKSLSPARKEVHPRWSLVLFLSREEVQIERLSPIHEGAHQGII